MFDTLAIDELGRKLAAVDPDVCTPEDLCDAALALTKLVSYAETASAHVFAALDALGTCDAEYGLPSAAWVARETRTDVRVLRSRLQVGRALRRHLGEVDDAVVSGRVSYAHAKVLASATRNRRVTDFVVGLQGELVDDAESMSFPAWTGRVRDVVELLDQDGPHDPNAELAKNWLHCTSVSTGDCVSRASSRPSTANRSARCSRTPRMSSSASTPPITTSPPT